MAIVSGSPMGHKVWCKARSGNWWKAVNEGNMESQWWKNLLMEKLHSASSVMRFVPTFRKRLVYPSPNLVHLLLKLSILR